MTAAPPHLPFAGLTAAITARVCCPGCRRWGILDPWGGLEVSGAIPPDVALPAALIVELAHGGLLTVALVGFELADPHDRPALSTRKGAAAVKHLRRALAAPSPPPRLPPPPPRPVAVPCPVEAPRQSLTGWGQKCPPMAYLAVGGMPARVAAAYRRTFGSQPPRVPGRPALAYSLRELQRLAGDGLIPSWWWERR